MQIFREDSWSALPKTPVLSGDEYFPGGKYEQRIPFASLAIMSVMAVLGTTSLVYADNQQPWELRARQNKQINGFETELCGDDRERVGRDRLNAELEKINLPVGTPLRPPTVARDCGILEAGACANERNRERDECNRLIDPSDRGADARCWRRTTAANH